MCTLFSEEQVGAFDITSVTPPLLPSNPQTTLTTPVIFYFILGFENERKYYMYKDFITKLLILFSRFF